jgi:hypothetical protein
MVQTMYQAWMTRCCYKGTEIFVQQSNVDNGMLSMIISVLVLSSKLESKLL